MALGLMGDGTNSFAMLLCDIVMEQMLGLVHDTAEEKVDCREKYKRAEGEEGVRRA